MISCGSRLAPFDISQLREIMSYDEMELDRMGDRRTATFFCISDTDSTYNFLVALAFSQMFNLLCERADNVHGGRLPHHVRVLWDEAANTGQVPNLEKLVAVIRSREVSLTLFYQQLAQCKAIYDKNAETILGNMDSVVFLGGRESSTIKEISENWLGKATISMQTDGRTRGQSESYSQNNQRLGRELMTPSELATVAHIMDHWLEYSGHTVNFRTQKLSYKSKKTIYNSQDKWVIFKNTHEAIWTEDIVEAVQAARGNRRRITKMGEMGLFSGLAFCADCGAKLYHCRTASWTREQECYSCATYRSRKGCSAHYIRAVVLEELVLQNIQRVLAYVQDDETEFVKLVQRNESYASSVSVDKAKKALQKNEVRIAELDTIIKRLYEDNILGKISDERFAKMSTEYEQEQARLEKESLELRETISASESRVVDVERFLKTVRKYTAPAELTPILVRELVDKIIVHAPDKSSGHRVQRIDIHYKFIGEIELSPEYSKYIKKTTA